MKTFALIGTVPAMTERVEDPPMAERVVSLTAPSFKQPAESGAAATPAAKKVKATNALLGTS